MEQKSGIIQQILEGEWAMFSTVNGRAIVDPLTKGSLSCQDFPDEFRVHRTAKLMAWSEQTLTCYLADITGALDAGKNLMTHKYARMDNLIPCENHSPHIDKIAVTLLEWQREFMEQYPRLMSGGRTLSGGKPGMDWASFETYMRAELETYSEKTLLSLLNDTETFKKKGKSMSEEIYLHLVRAKGYHSLEEAENK